MKTQVEKTKVRGAALGSHKTDNPLQLVTFHMTKEDLDEYEAIAKKHRISRAELLRKAASHMLPTLRAMYK